MRGQLKKLVRHSSVYAMGNLLSKALFILLVPLYTRLLTKDDYGALMLINGGLAVLSVSYEMGATSALMRLYYDFDSEVERRRYVGSIWAFVLLTTLAATVMLTAVGPWLVKPLYRGIPYWPYLVAMFWIAWLGTANDVPATLFRIKEQSLRFVAFVLAQTATLLLATIFFVAVLHKGLGGAIAGVLVANGAFFVIYSVVTLRNVTATLSWINAKRTLAYGVPVVALHAGWWVLDASDRFILRYFTTLDVVAVYGVGYVVGKALQMITTSINQAWTPFFFRIVKEKDPEAKRLFAYTATGFAFVLAFLGLAIAVFAREAVLAVGGHKYVGAIGITPVIALASVCQGMFFVPSRGLYLLKKTKLFPLIIGLASAVNIGLNFWLIPAYGMAG